MKNSWISLEINNLPPENRIFEFLHPEYGIIKGSIVRYEGERPGYKESFWVYPEPDPVSQADIWIEEFTHYRRIK